MTTAHPPDSGNPPELDGSPVNLLMNINRANIAIIPILAQRLLINMRKIDYMGSEPVASKLLFAPPPLGSEDDRDGDFESLERAQEPSGLRRRESAGEGSDRGEVDVRASSV
ncbi:hypothetical protein FA13DRAFT_1717026 [Coprinellus micaceus]|uniref:Uncharacterized protein n=1 Tax=Coprinellus micaceus TaxID=71717 RepID=A0A4Y7SIE9_COPMI|nr:hypothetical protein FA13DRAFT_1717026 [Coprinellus micaceus]